MVLWSVDCTDSGYHGIYAAYVAAPADLVVSLLAPALTPRVLYYPVCFVLEADRRIAGRTITHQKHSVIQMLSTNIRTGNTSNIRLHEHRIYTNCKGDERDISNQYLSNEIQINQTYICHPIHLVWIHSLIFLLYSLNNWLLYYNNVKSRIIMLLQGLSLITP